MGAMRDLVDRLDSQRDALMSRLGAVGQSTSELTLPGLLEILAWGQSAKTGDVLPARPLNRDNFEAILSDLGRQRGIPITASEAREILSLLTTGEIFQDLQTGLAAAVRLGPQVPLALVHDALALPELPPELVAAIRQDLHDDPARSPRDVLLSLGEGRLDRRLLTNTLRVLLGLAAPGAVVAALRTLIAPDNPTFRLAIVVYARLHGVTLDVEDVDAVYRAIDPAHPDLAPLFAQGLTRVREKYGRAEDALAFLRRLSASR